MELWLAGLIVLGIVAAIITALLVVTHRDRARGAKELERIRAEEARWQRQEEQRRDMLRKMARDRLYDGPDMPRRSEPSPSNRRRDVPVYSAWEEPMAYPANPTPSRRDLDELTDRSPGRFETGGAFGGGAAAAAAAAAFATGGGFGGEPDRFSSGGGFDSSSSSSGSDSSSSSSFD